VSGTVVSSDNAGIKPGDQVIVTGYDLGVSHDGGYAEYVRVPAEWVVPLPPGLSLFDAMALGTAGFTAALSIVELERNGLKPGNGPVIVTGATGGVGSMAVGCLTRLGYEVTALTGKETERDFLRSLGATNILLRQELKMGTRPLESATWAGAVDAVGGDILAWLTRTMKQGGGIACSGLTAGVELHTTVMPFILRGVKLLGIDSAMYPRAQRIQTWQRLGSDLRPANLDQMTQEIDLGGLPRAFDTLLKGGARGRFVVKI
jgi:NADPH2:quinone reductase